MAEFGQELRQPLTVIAGTIEMLQKSYFGSLTESQLPAVEMIAASGHHLDELIDKMVKIAGMPASLPPDLKLLDNV
jgi:signal transduction histidine kinase